MCADIFSPSSSCTVEYFPSASIRLLKLTVGTGYGYPDGYPPVYLVLPKLLLRFFDDRPACRTTQDTRKRLLTSLASEHEE